MKTLVDVQQLVWQPQTRKILDDINFTVQSGEVIGIIGPNGAGKTSLLRCIQGFATQSQGRVLFKGKNVHQISRKTLARAMAVGCPAK